VSTTFSATRCHNESNGRKTQEFVRWKAFFKGYSNVCLHNRHQIDPEGALSVVFLTLPNPQLKTARSPF
jgi:hypothetical protein